MIDNYIENRTHLIEITNDLLKKVSTSNDMVAVNVGSGKNNYAGMINIDKYMKSKGIIPADMCHLPFKEGTVDLIFSEHSLEHLPLRHSSRALIGWYTALKKGGTLFLSMPDLDLVLKSLLEPDLSPEARRWRLYTLFGYQTDMEINDYVPDPPVDSGQFHCSGHSLKTLTEELTSIGYKVEESFNYEGFGTPGLFMRATKL